MSMEPVCLSAPQGRRLPCALRLVAMALTVLVLSACASAPLPEASRPAERGRPAGQAEEGTALWVLRFYNEVNPDAVPTSLDLSVEDAMRTQGRHFVFKPLYSVAGRWVEFVVRLDLPAGEYRVSRLLGVGGSGKMAPQFNFSVAQRFTVEPARTHYFGRIEIINRPRNDTAGVPNAPAVAGASTPPAASADGSPTIELLDKSRLDLASLRARFADLRSRRIDNGLSPGAPLQEATTEPSSPSSSPSPSPTRAPPRDASRKTESGRYDERAEEGTVLWVARFFNEVNPDALPGNLALVVEDVAGTHGGQFAFKPLYSVAGRWVEFVVRLDLPAGEYRVSRLFGVAGRGQMAPQFDFSAEQRFTVEPARTHYLGRLEIVNRPRQGEEGVATGPSFGGAVTQQAGFADGSPMIELSDRSHLDLASLRARFADLRDRRIDNGLSKHTPLQEAKPAPRTEMPIRMRRAFAEFTVTALPRAFAHDPAGSAFGMASGGPDAAARALRQCEQRRGHGPSAAPGRSEGADTPPRGAASAGERGGPSACVLYAQDDVVLTEPPPPALMRAPGQTSSR
jgi:hypothetical protein